MAFNRFLASLAAAAAVLLLASCGGGGSPGDVHPGTNPVAVAGEPNAFLLFPNPQVQPDGSLQTDTPAYAQTVEIKPGPQPANMFDASKAEKQ